MTYEYECTKCKRTFEAEQRITDPPLAWCDATVWEGARAVRCGGALRRLVSETAFMLKGSGWAKDGYR